MDVIDTYRQSKYERLSLRQDILELAFELLVVFLIAISLLGLMTALFGWFKSEVVFVFSLLLTLIYGLILKRCGIAFDKKHNVLAYHHILLIILIGILFRLPPYHYVLGNIDQGVYVNVASSIERTGAVVAVDPVIGMMTGSHLIRYVKDNYSSCYLPGVYKTDKDAGNIGIEFQFYHLFPVWMAVFEGMFGSRSGVYALTLLSIVSLLLCYWLILILTRHNLVALTGALLLALNPLHAFYSKLPVTEIPTLAFSLAGFSCLAVYWLSANHQTCKIRFLVLSALSFGCLFTTRITGFMYVPTFFAILTAVLLGEESKDRKIPIIFWSLFVFFLYGISVWYGLTWSNNYSTDIYRSAFSKIFGEEWPIGVTSTVLALSVVTIFFIFVSTKAERLRKILSSMLEMFVGKLGLIFLVILVVGLYKVYQFAFTDIYTSDPWLGQRWGLANRGLQSVSESSLVSSSIYASPLIFFVFLYFMIIRWGNHPIQIAKLFLLTVFSYVALLQFVIWSQPNNARYLLSEFIPYMIIFVIWGWSLMANTNKKKVVTIALVVAALYSGCLSFLQLGKEEQRGAYDSLSKIVADVGKNDLILLHGERLWTEIKTPLVFKFGKNVASISDDSLFNSEYISYLISNYDHVYMISSDKFAIDGLKYFGNNKIKCDTYRAQLPPRSLATKYYNLFIYGGTWSWVNSVSSKMSTNLHPLSLKNRDVALLHALGDGWHSLETEHVWSKAKADIKFQIPEICRSKRCSLTIDFWVFGASQQRPVEVGFTYDTDRGKNEKKIAVTNGEIRHIDIPLLRTGTSQNIAIYIPQAASPRLLGFSGDARILGIALQSMKLSLFETGDDGQLYKLWYL